MRVYLSGDMSGDWMDKAQKHLEGRGHDVLNPKEFGSDRPRSFAVANKYAVEEADCVLAYMEADNPSGRGLSFECGYALGLGKPVVYAEDSSIVGTKISHDMAMVRLNATNFVRSWEEAVEVIEDA
jgi:nucleoside 2-deoxyribosyltransferase